jgi:hypothetical protein
MIPSKRDHWRALAACEKIRAAYPNLNDLLCNGGLAIGSPEQRADEELRICDEVAFAFAANEHIRNSVHTKAMNICDKYGVPL